VILDPQRESDQRQNLVTSSGSSLVNNFVDIRQRVRELVTLYGHIKIAEQRTVVQQCGDWYTGRQWVGYYIWYSEEGPGRPVPASLY